MLCPRTLAGPPANDNAPLPDLEAAGRDATSPAQ